MRAHSRRGMGAPLIMTGVVLVMIVGGCGREPGSTSVTKGMLTVECDEAVGPVMKEQVDQFQRQYTDARVSLRTAQAREAVVDFANDSVRVIVCARAFDGEEQKAFDQAKVQYQKYKVAMTAVAVVVNADNPVTELRVSQLDSMFSGDITRWSGTMKRVPIDLVIGGINSSTNEVFREKVLKGERFAASATPIDSSRMLVDYVKKTPGAIGIVGLNQLQDDAEHVRVVALGTPGYQPDSTEPVGKFYHPDQYYVFKEYYPISTPVYIYTREASIDLGVGFISYVSSLPGQTIFQKSNLVPVTIPVRWVQTTSRPIQTSSEQVQ